MNRHNRGWRREVKFYDVACENCGKIERCDDSKSSHPKPASWQHFCFDNDHMDPPLVCSDCYWNFVETCEYTMGTQEWRYK